ncbi:MAG: 4Fe-4S binding protein [Bacteroidota bacterium]|nr:4Fe-4S binding protein [Bacteroidota bacterium]
MEMRRERRRAKGGERRAESEGQRAKGEGRRARGERRNFVHGAGNKSEETAFLYSIFNVRNLLFILTVFLLLLSVGGFAQEQRFPKPDFETGYVQPDTSTPEPRSLSLEFIDVFILIAVMSLAAWFVFKSRSRLGILLLSIFSLIYFGFYREGCICSIGSIQNISLSFFDPAYTVSLPTLAFFILPLLFTLFFGRLFCGSACPLGVIQDLVNVKPIEIPQWLQKSLGLFPYIYLGLAVLFAATGTDFIICRFDPFVGIFRMGAEFHIIILGISFLLMSLFVGRPYCRFVCPYGVLLSWVSRFSWKHLSITPSKCIQCKLCTTSCPFDVIDYPTNEKLELNSKSNRRNFTIWFLLIPVWMLVFGFTVSKAHIFLSKANSTVYLAELLIAQPELISESDNLDIDTFRSSGKTIEQLIEEARIIQAKFYTGSWILGIFLGLVIGIMLMNQFRFRKRKDYEANRADCLSCGRCMDYCPVPE